MNEQERIAGGPSPSKPRATLERVAKAPEAEPMARVERNPPEPSPSNSGGSPPILSGVVNPTLIGMQGTRVVEGGDLVDLGRSLRFEASIFNEAVVLRAPEASLIVGWGVVEALAGAWATKQAMDRVESVLGGFGRGGDDV
jgi:hypothetical protein